MTFEKTVILSAVLHAVILAALFLSYKRSYIVMPPFEVDLVSPPSQGISVPKRAESATPAPVRPKAAKEIPKAAPRIAPEKQKSSMAVQPETTKERDEEKSLINHALSKIQRTYSRNEEEKSLINNELARLQGIADVEKRVRLKGTLEINRKTSQTGAAPSVGVPGGNNTALSSYIAMVASMIRERWFYLDLKTQGMRAVITIVILKDGTIVPRGFDKRSGNALLDESAMRAIERTEKVPPPPYELEIAVGFTP